MESSGIIDLLKPAGMTSHDCIAVLRRITGIKSIGHTGTLDPMAIGVLPVCIGKGTRVISYMEKERKSYRCELMLGLETDTLDIWGKPLHTGRKAFPALRKEDWEELLSGFEGPQMQVPPQYAAIKVDGKKLYEYARKGIQVEASARPVTFYALRSAGCAPEEGRLLFDAVCSPGTYIRSLVRDIGLKLGCGASMSFLLRTGSGPFTLEQSHTLEEVKEDWQSCLLPLDYALDHLGRLDLKAHRMDWYSHGGYLADRDLLSAEAPEEGDLYRVYGEGRFLGTARLDREQETYFADKVLI